MQILQTIISYLAIAAAFISSLFPQGDIKMIPFTNDYEIPDSIPEYSIISTNEKTEWKAKWIWDKENLTEKRKIIKQAKAASPRKIELVCLKNRYGISSFSCFFDYFPAYDLFDKCAKLDFEQEYEPPIAGRIL
jgi:hypothetical protein